MSLLIAITHNHVFRETPGHTITHPNSAQKRTQHTDQSRTRRFPWSHNHGSNHANHGIPITLDPLSLREREGGPTQRCFAGGTR